MAFHFKKAESPAESVRRRGHEQIGAALGRWRKRGRPSDIHYVRKEIKKLRALLRLVRENINSDDYHKGAKALRKAADSLAGTRDARVMWRAFEKLAGRSAEKKFPQIRKALLKNYRHETRRFQRDHSAAAASRILKKIDRRVRGLKINAEGWAMIEPGLKHCYTRGRETCRLASKEPSPEPLHRWRKQVKDFWHYFCLLSPIKPATMGIRTNELSLLGELLGDDHDFFVLQQFLAKNCANQAGEMEALNEFIETRQRRLRAAALKLGSHLYAETPVILCRRLASYWSAWRGEARRN